MLRARSFYLSRNEVSSVTAALQAVTDPSLARNPGREMKDPAGSLPRYYQIVLKVKSMDDMPVKISYMFHCGLPCPNETAKR